MKMVVHFITTVVDILSKPQFKLTSTCLRLLYSFFTVVFRFEGRYPMWFYEEKLDTPTTSPISHDQVLSFRMTNRHTGYYFCYGNFHIIDHL